MSTNTPKATVLAHLQALISGLQSQLPNESFTLGNSVFTTTSLVQLIQTLIVSIQSVNTAQASAKVAVSNMRATNAKVGPVIRDLQSTLVTRFGNASDILALFDLEPHKAPRPRTAEQLAAAKAKAKATREARGTTSKKQKLTVKGNVAGVAMTPNLVGPLEPEPSQPATPATAPIPAGK